MNNKDYNIGDDEFHVIGQQGQDRKDRKKKLLKILLNVLAVLLCATIITLILQFTVFSSTPKQDIEPIGNWNLGIDYPYTEKIDTIVKGLELTLYVPHNASPSITIGSPDSTSLPEEAVLAFRAADLSLEGKLVGVFVCDGVVYQSKKESSSKLGYCAVIDGEITIGTAESTPLFEKAVEHNGGFFRQHSLVADGKVMTKEVEEYGKKTLRRALCERGGQVFVAVCTEGSMHNLAMALASLGVDNAVYLLGFTKSYGGWWRDVDGKVEFSHTTDDFTTYEFENYIVWK